MEESRQDAVIEDAEIVMRLGLSLDKNSILVNGQDITKQVQSVSFDMRAGELARVNLHCIAKTISVEATGDIALRPFGQRPLLILPRAIPSQEEDDDEPAAV